MRRSVQPLSLLALLTLLGAVGCARNGVFELEVELPPQPAGSPALFAVVDARRAGVEAPTLAEGIPLNANCVRPDPAPPCLDRTLDPECSQVVSVVSGGDLSRPLRLTVRFCEDPACLAPGDTEAPGRRIEVERAFYAGHFTQGRVCVDAVPDTPELETDVIERCEVRCREGVVRSSCYEDGRHFCE